MHEALLQKLNPDTNSLMAALSKQVDDEMLLEIAGADYGMYTDLYLIDLQKIRDAGAVPIPLTWSPREVLNLMQYDYPPKGDETSRTSDAIVRPHLMRAFVCAALIQSSEDPSNLEFLVEQVVPIATLLDSLPLLDASIQAEALRFFAWRAQVLPDVDNENPFWLLGLLLLVLRIPAPVTQTDITCLIDWIYSEVSIMRQNPWLISRRDIHSDQWLTWLSAFNQRHNLWQDIGHEIAHLANQPENAETHQALKTLASHLETF